MNNLVDNIFLVMEMRRMGIADIKVMEAVERISIDLFPDENFINEFYEETTKESIPLNRFLAVALICETLKIEKNHKILEIGTGSGYQTAVLAKLCRRIYSIDSNKDALQYAEKIITNLNISNFTLMKADIEQGLENQAPFDRIIINRIFYKIPDIIKNQLKEDGIIIAPLGFPEREDHILKSFSLKNNELIENKIAQLKFIYP